MSFLEEINGKYGQLSPVQKRIADYIFTYPEEVCFNSLKELSQALGVTEVTILRFVKKVGLTSFVEMKKKLKDYLQTRFSQDETQGYPAGRSGVKMGQDLDKEEMYRNFVENEIRVLKSTYMQNGIERVLNAVSIIKGAGIVSDEKTPDDRYPRGGSRAGEPGDLQQLYDSCGTGGCGDHLFESGICKTSGQYEQISEQKARSADRDHGQRGLAGGGIRDGDPSLR